MKNLLLFSTLLLFFIPSIAFSQWTQLGIDLDGEAGDDTYGWTVSTNEDGTVIAIGGYQNDGNGNNAGHARIFDWNGVSWIQRGLDIDGNMADEWLGHSVSLSSDGNTVAISALTANNTLGLTSGVVRVFDWNGAAWVRRGADLEGEGDLITTFDFPDFFGYEISISSDGNVVAAGGPNNDGNGSSSGHIRVFEWNGTNWIQRGSDIDGVANASEFGHSISISADGSIVAAGARNDDTNGNDAGHVRVFEWNGTTWMQRGSTINGDAADHEMGDAVSLSDNGNVLAVGAPEAPTGIVRVFDWDGSDWMQRGVDILGEEVGDSWGNAISLSADGNILSAGASSNTGSGFLAGHARVFAWDGAAWIQQGMDLDAEASLDIFGGAVSLSGDGHTFIVGGFGNDGTAPSAGHARVFDGCFDERLVQNHIINYNTAYRARNFIQLDNVTVNPTEELTATAPEVLMDNGFEVKLGATLCIIPSDGCQ